MRSMICTFVLMISLGGISESSWKPLLDHDMNTKPVVFHLSEGVNGKLVVGGEGGVYLSDGYGKKLKRVLKFKSTSSLSTSIAIDDVDDAIYLGSTEGLYRSFNKGLDWDLVYSSFNLSEQTVLDFKRFDGRLWIGSQNGMFVSSDNGISWRKNNLFNTHAIYQIDSYNYKDRNQLIVATDKGIYLFDTQSNMTQQIYRSNTTQHSHEDEVNENVEDIPIHHHPLSITLLEDGNLLIFEEGALSEYDVNTGDLRSLYSGGHPRNASHSVPLGQDDKFLFASNQGLFIFDYKNKSFYGFQPTYPSSKVSDVLIDKRSDRILIASGYHIQFLENPSLSVYIHNNNLSNRQAVDSFHNYFDNEPTILELQKIAIDYAEVSPEKIESWRAAVKQKAWLPTVTVGYDHGSDETVELDRGGTNDPDTFIIGPEESDNQWSINASWDLSDLIWNDGQTSIDNRSKLMVQLRDDLMNELIHLYFARRQLQMEMLMEAGVDFKKDLFRSLQINQYTAGLDALTGGYFSKQVKLKISIDEGLVKK